MLQILVKYHNPDLEKLNKISVGDWIDLRSAETRTLKQGEFTYLNLGVSMKLPEGYEAHMAPRSSTFKNFGVIQTNSVAVIDNSYSGENDIWKWPIYATRDTTINFNDRVCQFRIMKVMEPIEVKEVEHLEGPNRGGLGSTGVK